MKLKKDIRNVCEKIEKLIVHYYSKDTEINVTLFKILGTAGILISIIAGTQSIATGISVSGGLIDYLAAFASVLLLWFVDKTGKYIYGFVITSVSIFMILFSILFFEMGGMDGSMPYFFAFGIVFVFLMFKGKLLVLMEILQVGVYTFVCVYSVLNPQSVAPFASAKDRFIDQLMGIFFAGVGIGLIFLAYIAQYRKQKDIADEANLAKSRFLANMSHEIRTPINMMMGMNEMIIRESESEAIKAYSLNALDAGKQLISVVNQILQYSKLEVGKDQLVEADYDFFKMINSLREFFEKEAASKNLSFNLSIDDEIEPALIGDMRKIMQILTNLLSNAVKYTREGSVSFSVKNLGKSDGMQRLSFEVKDTGIGIEETEIKKIFDSFERLDLLKNRNIEGTGLGLAIAKHLALMMDGTIEVESSYGEGSTFKLLLNQKQGSLEAINDTHGDVESFVAPEAKILAVDDNEMNLNVLKSLLKKTMVTVDTATSALACYEKCDGVRYDLIFMDYMMPDIDGVEAMKHLRAGDRNAKIPIIALTADVSLETEEKLLSEGFDGYLTKPIDWKQLEACLMEKLPQELVTRTGASNNPAIDNLKLEVLSKILKDADIELSEGLHYMGGDIIQYARVAEYFIANSVTGIENLRKSIENSDFEKTTYILHSLKGNARNVGSIELHYMSKRLEKRCRERDTEYLRKSAELLLFEWNRVVEGLKNFLEVFTPMVEESEEQGNGGDDLIESVEAKLAALLKALENCQQIPALNIISDLMNICDNEAVRNKLIEVKKFILEIEFEAAEEIAGELLRNIGVGLYG